MRLFEILHKSLAGYARNPVLLVPGFVGLYQVNAIVPAGIAPGDAVPLTLSAAGQTGPASLLSVR